MLNRTSKLVSVFLLFILFGLSGCESLVDKGNKLYEQGLYTQAASYYEKALAQDPNNVEATAGLQQARNMIIDRGLIEVRMNRLANHHRAAALKLESILRNQRDWSISMQGAVAATQTEEVRYANRWLTQEIKRLHKLGDHNQFKQLTINLKNIIAMGKQTHVIKQYEGDFNSKGIKQCQRLTLLSVKQRFFLNEFTQHYCGLWGVTAQSKLDSYDQNRFRSIAFRNQVSTSSEELNQYIEASMRRFKRAFKQSIWYDPASQRVLTVDLQGQINYNNQAGRAKRKKNYMVNVETRKTSGENTTHVNVQEQQRTYLYWVDTFYETLSMNLKMQANLVGATAASERSKAINNSTQAHNESFEAAQISPEQAQFIDKESWVAQNTQQLQEQFSLSLDDIWSSHYCRLAKVNNGPEKIEALLRCLRLQPGNSVANSWFNAEFGMTYEALSQLWQK